jgi:NAD-dependent dihydropyrimidine dehydrogenase PreA subunit
MKLTYLRNVASLKLTNPDACTGCELCVEVCPHNVFNVKDQKVKIMEIDACMECGACQKNCPAGVIAVNAGVGCAQAIINGIFTKSDPSCGCSSDSKKTGCCG